MVVCSPPDVVSPAIEPFWREMEQTDTFSFIGQRLRSTPSQGCCLLEHLRVWPELCRACTVVGGEFLSGFVLYGIPVGLSRFVKHHWPGHPLVGHGLVWWPAAAYWLGRPGRSSRWLSAGLCSRKWVEKRDFSEHKIDLVCSCPVLAGHCELKSWF